MALVGSRVRDSNRADVGMVTAVLLEVDSKESRWLEVALPAGRGSVLVPTSAASQVDVDELLVPYTVEQIEAARHESGAAVTVAESQRLRRHYGFDD